MKLLSCHIENFGKLHQCDFDFVEGMNCFRDSNGWGKSTLAAFIKAMFYGMEGEKKRSLENERKKYKPWQGGAFGGNLSFEAGGKKYVITRFFAEKEINDEFEIRDAETNLLSQSFTSNIGAELFNINREAFGRTVFIAQNGCETGTNDDINAKVGNLTDNMNDLDCFEKAQASLKNLMNSLNPMRRTGSIVKRKEEIALLETQIKRGEGTEESIRRHRELCEAESRRLAELKKEIRENKKLQERLAEQNSLLAVRERFGILHDDAEKHKAELERIKSLLPERIPAPDETDEWPELIKETEKLKERMREAALTDLENEKLSILKSGFEGRDISDDKIDEQLVNNAKLQKLYHENASSVLNEEEKIRLSELTERFSKDNIQPSEAMALWNRRCGLAASLEGQSSVRKVLKNSYDTQKRKKMVNAGILIAGLCLIALGAVSAFIVSVKAAFCCGVIGVLLLLLPLFSGTRKKKQELREEMSTLEKSCLELEGELERLDDTLNRYLSSHGGGAAPEGILPDLQRLLEEEAELSALQKRKEKAGENGGRAEMTKLCEEIEKLVGNAPEGFEADGISSDCRDYSKLLYSLKQALAEYYGLISKAERYAEYESAYNEKYSQISKIAVRNNISPGEDMILQLTVLRRNLEGYFRERKDFDEAMRSLQLFCEKNDMDDVQQALPAMDCDIREMSRRYLELTEQADTAKNKIRDYERIIGELQDSLDELEEKQRELNNLKEQQIFEEKRYRLLKIAGDKLEEAKQALVSRYVGPLLKSFHTYSKAITGEAVDRFHMDSDINITVDELGKQRNTETLSAGLRDLVGICLRISFADAMFPEEKPFLILDDPFVNLDDDKLNGVRELMKQVTESYQVIYFTCSSSRELL